MEQWGADDARRRHMARFGRRDTAPELALRRELHRRGRRFFVDRQVSRQCRVRPDLVFPRARIAVFVDGCFWHLFEEHTHLPKANAELWRRKLLANRQRDARNQAILTTEGWRVVRSWEHDDLASQTGSRTSSTAGPRSSTALRSGDDREDQTDGRRGTSQHRAYRAATRLPQRSI